MLSAVFLVLLATGPPILELPADSDSPEQAQRLVRRVMNSGLNFAEQRLAERGEFNPFGAVMLPDGLIQHVAAAAPDENAPADVMYGQLTHALREKAESGAFKVVATFALVELRDPQDGSIVNAVQVGLEHRDGYCIDVFFPTISQDRTLRLGEAFSRERDGTFFPCSGF